MITSLKMFAGVAILLALPITSCKQVTKKMGKEAIEQTARNLPKETTEQSLKASAKSTLKKTIVSGTRLLSNEEIDQLLKKVPAKPSFWHIFSKDYSNDLIRILSQLDSRAKEDLLHFLKNRKNIKIFIDDFNTNPELIRIINRFPQKGIDVYGRLANVGLGSSSSLVEWLNNFERYIIRDKMGDAEVYLSLSITKLKDGKVVFTSTRYPASEIIFDGRKMIAKAGGKGPHGGPINEFLMTKRIPNMEYEIDGIIFKTDRLGRTASIKGEVSPTHLKNKSVRNQQTQTSSVKRMGGNKSTDQGGHGWGYQFGGPNEDINLTPMSRIINNGEYKKIENTITNAIKQGKIVKINIQNVYKNGDESMRPIAYVYEYVIDGKVQRVVMQNI